MQPRSGLHALKRSWSSGTEHAPPAAPAPAPPAPVPELDDVTNTGAPKRRRFDSSWAPFLKPRASSLNDILGPPARKGRVDEPGAAPTAPAPLPDAPPRKVNRIFLSDEQQAVLDAVVNQGKNVFFTGSAGTGKSVLLQYVISGLRDKFRHKPDAVAVTASTGIAACNVGGTTLHSFGGVGLARESPERLLSLVRRNRKAVTRWMRTQVLIIDEISMIEPALLEKFEHLARLVRRSNKVFGGIQIVVTGDFFQLPPVTHNGDAMFVFESRVWEAVIEQKYNLTQVFRQKDTRFVSMLNEMRYGRLSHESIRTFQSLERAPALPPDITPTELFPLRRDVERANQTRLDAIAEESRVYTSYDTGTLQGEQRERLLENFMAPRHVCLKRGAQVMLIKNIEDTLVNGSIGIVLDFVDDAAYEDEHGDEGASGASGASGARKSGRLWPLVRFFLPHGGMRDQLIRPEVWTNEDVHGDALAQRRQVPLILAWAISIHKSQGQTLAACKIDLRRVFEKGQAYVALSRATSLDALQVIGFHPSKVMAHPKVIRWSRAEFNIGL